VHIYTVKADGTGLTQVTSGDGSEYTPSWSPDGTTMAVDAAEPGLAEGISILDVATGTLTPITANPYGIFDTEPQYSPDGAWVTFTRLQSFSPPRSAVFVVRADGSSLQRLTPWRLNAAESDWSPDGSRIAFNSADENIKYAHVYLVNPDGTDLTRITSDSYSAFRPCWSPDGTRIVFTRIRVGIHG